jgi:hypothetical protein
MVSESSHFAGTNKQLLNLAETMGIIQKASPFPANYTFLHLLGTNERNRGHGACNSKDLEPSFKMNSLN